MPRGQIGYAQELEWALACRWWGDDPDRWFWRDGDAQAFRIAVYRTHAQIEAVTAWEQHRRQERAMKGRR